ncbi:uncharacterized protein LOC122264382 [Penaeus japonicus]|uniref:uncharacterized protein LOC122264382 n=1 Tax=Penaeus japonicus TaxID=27405 RepID=UPI001C714E93|nr:uncharacterized protein LOC122264382 [Penaeus japonicus]
MASFDTQVKVAAVCVLTYMLTATLIQTLTPLLQLRSKMEEKGMLLDVRSAELRRRGREGGNSKGMGEERERGRGEGMGERGRERKVELGKGVKGREGLQERGMKKDCQAMFTLDKRGQFWEDDRPYAKLSQQLPSLLTSGNGGTAGYPGTRINLMNGSVPYVPCKVRQYDPNDLESCSQARSSRGHKTWIAFVGDSNCRQKVHSILSFLPPDLEYTFFLGDRQVSREDFIVTMYYHNHRPLTFDVFGRRRGVRREGYQEKEGAKEARGDINPTPPPPPPPLPPPPPPPGEYQPDDIFRAFEYSGNKTRVDFSIFGLRDSEVPLESYEVRVTMVWAPLGSQVMPPVAKERIGVARLREWAEQDVIPDIIVFGLGKWFMLEKEDVNELIPYTDAQFLLRPLVAPLTRLAARTHVLWWHQSRYRWFNFETNHHTPWKTDVRKYWEQVLSMNQFRDGIPFMDNWLWRTSLRDTGMWQWDSTVPFNLANLQECLSLRESGAVEDKLYTGKWWNCRDAHHSSYETNADEIQMLLNLLCNPYVASHEDYCCSGVDHG